MDAILDSKSYVKFAIGRRRSGKTEIAKKLIRRLSKDDRLFIFCRCRIHIENYGPFFPSNVFIKDINDFEMCLKGISENNVSIFIDDVFNCKSKIIDLLPFYKFKSIYVAGSPINDLSLNLVKKFYDLYKDDVSFFEIPGGLLNETEEVAYNIIMNWLNVFLKIKIGYTKFELIMDSF